MKLFYSLLVLSIYFSANAQVDILVENFDNSGLPSGWTRVDNDNNTPAEDVNEYTKAWIYKEDPINAGNGTFSSTSYFDPIDRADRWLITPQVTLGSSGNYISWKGLSHDASFPDSYKVMISTTSNDISDFTDTLVVISNELPEWTDRLMDLEEYADETIYLAFVNTTFDGFKLYLDSVYVREQDPLSIEEYEAKSNDTKVFPNPTTDKLNISGDHISEIEIHSVTGNVIYKSEENFTNNISMAKYPEGVYFVSIVLDDGRIERHKIVKQ
ncbi:MAG: choice-of-anchor J domain-containing protein [Brumimicrobium sp.]